MTQTVVDALEIVDVEKQHCGQKSASSGACQFSRKVFFKQLAVWEFGQGVVGRLAFQLAFEMLAFADVARNGGEKSRCTVRTAVGEHDLGNSDLPTIRVLDHIFSVPCALAQCRGKRFQ